MSSTITVRIDPRTKQELENMATKLGITVSNIIRDVTEIIVLASKAQEITEATVKFVHLILQRYPKPFDREIEFDIGVGTVKARCRIYVSDEIIDYGLSITVLPSWNAMNVWWYMNACIREYRDGKYPPQISYEFAYPPTKREFEIIIDALKRMLM